MYNEVVKKTFSYTLVSIQFLCIILLSQNAKLEQLSLFPIVLIFSGLFVGITAIYVMRVSKLHITPDVDKKAKLVTNGPYQYIRHPMYTAVLLVCFGLLLTNITLFSSALFALLTIDLIVKLFYEERLLGAYFHNYEAYKKNTFRIIPYVF